MHPKQTIQYTKDYEHAVLKVCYIHVIRSWNFGLADNRSQMVWGGMVGILRDWRLVVWAMWGGALG
eukprot:1016605-Amphidinium_carterae.1